MYACHLRGIAQEPGVREQVNNRDSGAMVERAKEWGEKGKEGRNEMGERRA